MASASAMMPRRWCVSGHLLLDSTYLTEVQGRYLARHMSLKLKSVWIYVGRTISRRAAVAAFEIVCFSHSIGGLFLPPRSAAALHASAVRDGRPKPTQSAQRFVLDFFGFPGLREPAKGCPTHSDGG